MHSRPNQVSRRSYQRRSHQPLPLLLLPPLLPLPLLALPLPPALLPLTTALDPNWRRNDQVVRAALQ